MTSALDAEYMPPDGWTTDDLDDMPADIRRRELIDGVLLVSPPLSTMHQSISRRLAAPLADASPPEHDVPQGVGVRTTNRRSLVPDVLVVAAEAAARNPAKYAPEDVILVVEV